MTNESIALEKITIEFPSTHTQFMHQLFRELHPMADVGQEGILFRQSNPAFLPKIAFTVTNVNEPRVLFLLSNGRTIKINITNMTGIEKSNPYAYEKYSLEKLTQYFKNHPIIAIDHVGCNMPWFVGGTHPLIAFLQTNLKNKCLYHLFPSGQTWDFIIPGTKDEILNRTGIDYTQTRKPKFELVSFENCSTPLVQIDVAVNSPFETFKDVFRHGIILNDLRQVWVYIENPLTIDICFVINEHRDNDWSNYFALSRIQ